MEYLDQGKRESLVRAKNDLGETPLHLAVSFVEKEGGSARTGSGGGRARAGGGGGRGGGNKREVGGIAVQVRGYDVTGGNNVEKSGETKHKGNNVQKKSERPTCGARSRYTEIQEIVQEI